MIAANSEIDRESKAEKVLGRFLGKTHTSFCPRRIALDSIKVSTIISICWFMR